MKTKATSKSWLSVLDRYSKLYCMDTGLREAATISAATLLSSKLPGDPVWTFLVGPASTGKTVIVESFAADTDHCESVSKLTAKTLISGWKDPQDPEREVSIFPLLKGRALLIKDYTTVLTLPGGTQEELYGMLRDCYDGYVRVVYGNGKIVDFRDIYFPLLAAVTDEIKSQNRSHLGERFLRCEILGRDHDNEGPIDAALDSSVRNATRVKLIKELGKAISACLDSKKFNLDKLPTLPSDTRDKIKALSQIVGFVRAFVPRDEDSLIYRPRPEGGSRVAKQLHRMGICIARLLDKPSIDDEVYHFLRKVGLDTVNGLSLETIQTLMRPGLIWTTNSLRDNLRLPKTQLVRRLHNLEQLGVLQRDSVPNGTYNGRDAHVWRPEDAFASLWERADLLPKKRRFVV